MTSLRNRFAYQNICYFTTRTINGKQNRAKLKPSRISSIQTVPCHILRPSYVGSFSTPLVSKDAEIHDAVGIEHMRSAGRLAASALEYAGTFVKPGITTDEIDKAVHKMIISSGAYPSPLGYKGFPKSICTSINECAFHGIPDFRPLEDGDIINIDVTIFLNGYHADTSRTFLCGDVDDDARQLVKRYCGCMSYCIMSSTAGLNCLNIVCSLTEEPLLTLGSTDYIVWDDDWTVVTADGSLSAQFEHTLLITETGVEILTEQS